MKSNKQRRQEIVEKRRKRAEKAVKAAAAEVRQSLDPQFRSKKAVSANHAKLTHFYLSGYWPEYYLDKRFHCIDCGSLELWTARQQKWWYEEAKGDMHSRAVRCLHCRKHLQALKEAQRRHMEAVANRPPHPHEAFFKMRIKPRVSNLHTANASDSAS